MNKYNKELSQSVSLFLKNEGEETMDNNIDREKKLEESRLVMKIVNRGWETMKRHYKTKLDMIMDIDAANKDCPLKLQELLDTDDFNFYHDLMGIGQHMNRNTGKLEDCFLPRFAK